MTPFRIRERLRTWAAAKLFKLIGLDLGELEQVQSEPPPPDDNVVPMVGDSPFLGEDAMSFIATSSQTSAPKVPEPELPLVGSVEERLAKLRRW